MKHKIILIKADDNQPVELLVEYNNLMLKALSGQTHKDHYYGPLNGLIFTPRQYLVGLLLSDKELIIN